jgi:hypothetical protein
MRSTFTEGAPPEPARRTRLPPAGPPNPRPSPPNSVDGCPERTAPAGDELHPARRSPGRANLLLGRAAPFPSLAQNPPANDANPTVLPHSTGPPDLDDLVLNVPVIPPQTRRAIFSIETPRTSISPSPFISASDHSLPVFTARGSSSASAPHGLKIDAPIRRSRASCSGLAGPLRNAPRSISVT